jgi:hypothetical protein
MTKTTSKERIASMETDIKNLSKGQDRIEKKIDAFISAADTKYAQKSVEREFKEFQKCTDKRLDKISVKIAGYGGAIAFAIIIIEFLARTNLISKIIGGG